MKILSVSDVVKPGLLQHSNSDSFADVDLILSCGDLPPEYLSRLVNSFKAPLYYVRGNHDIRYDEKPPQGCRDLHRMMIKNRGFMRFGEFNSFLMDLYKKRGSKQTLADLYPQIIEWFDINSRKSTDKIQSAKPRPCLDQCRTL